jgi:hypothetical protein
MPLGHPPAGHATRARLSPVALTLRSACVRGAHAARGQREVPAVRPSPRPPSATPSPARRPRGMQSRATHSWFAGGAGAPAGSWTMLRARLPLRNSHRAPAPVLPHATPCTARNAAVTACCVFVRGGWACCRAGPRSWGQGKKHDARRYNRHGSTTTRHRALTCSPLCCALCLRTTETALCALVQVTCQGELVHSRLLQPDCLHKKNRRPKIEMGNQTCTVQITRTTNAPRPGIHPHDPCSTRTAKHRAAATGNCQASPQAITRPAVTRPKQQARTAATQQAACTTRSTPDIKESAT